MKKVKVVTRPRTGSGYRGGKTIHLDANDAEEWIRRRWADPAQEQKPKQDAAGR